MSGPLGTWWWDPDAMLERIASALRCGDKTGALLNVSDLYGWLLAGGRAPDWSKFPEATEYYNDNNPIDKED